MIMVHKFNEAQNKDVPDYLDSALDIPQYENFGVVNSSERILLMIDEAHRSQAGDLGDNLFEAFPQATRLAFTGTGDILEADERIEDIAEDLVDHYIENILPNGFKAQVVCTSKMAAIKYKEFIDKALAARLAIEEAKPSKGDYVREPDSSLHAEGSTEALMIAAEASASSESGCRDDELCKQIRFLQSVVVISGDGTNEAAVITAARKHKLARQEEDVVALYDQNVSIIESRHEGSNLDEIDRGLEHQNPVKVLSSGKERRVEPPFYASVSIRP